MAVKAAVAGLAAFGGATMAQVASGEDIGIALEHSAGAGAFATIAVWLVLKGRVDGHSEKLTSLESGQADIKTKVDEISENVAYMAGRLSRSRGGPGSHSHFTDTDPQD